MKLEPTDLTHLRALQQAAKLATIEAQRQQLAAQEASMRLESAAWEIEERLGLVGQNPQINLRTGEIKASETVGQEETGVDSE